LTAHLALALAILVVALWTWAEVRPRGATAMAAATSAERAVPGAVGASSAWRLGTLALVVAIGITILSGGFVAGLRAGTIYNTFPLMGGAVVPPGYGQLEPWWTNAFENPIAAQFHHRVLAIL